MKLYLLFICIRLETQAGNVDVEGEITIKLKDPSNHDNNNEQNNTDQPIRQRQVEQEQPIKDQHPDPADAILEIEIVEYIEDKITTENNRQIKASGNENMTVAPMVECTYQMPEENQVHELLSNMMNELTKMFVRAHVFMNGRRKGAKRFSVIDKKQTEFFDHIYSNMTKQYLTFYNTTAIRVDRTERKKDPCENQEEMKELWKDLLDSSLMTFRQAALKCIDEHLKTEGEGKDSKLRKKMGHYLLREMSKIKMKQLTLLCDKFQLCFNELIRRHDRETNF